MADTYRSFMVFGWLLLLYRIFVFGPQMMIGMAAAECARKDLAGTATGFVGLFSYLGAALASYPMSLAIEAWGWEGFFCLITAAAAVIGYNCCPL